MSSFSEWVAQGPWPIDGGLSGELEKLGNDLSDDLWSARLLKDDPAAIAAVHQAYVDAGARVIITSSYQASRFGFANAGLTHDQADDLMRASITIAKDVVATASAKVWVAASVGPFGAVLGNGEEYRGNYGKTHQELVDFHRERLMVLASAQPDLFACETIPDLVEVNALLEVLADFPGIPAWITMSCKDSEHTCAGQPIAEFAQAVAGNDQIVAIGMNCTMPEYIAPLFTELRKHSDKPFVVYPNAGRVWDGPNHCWIGEGLDTIPVAAVNEWVALGAKLIGGCCGLGPNAITSMDRDLATMR